MDFFHPKQQYFPLLTLSMKLIVISTTLGQYLKTHSHFRKDLYKFIKPQKKKFRSNWLAGQSGQQSKGLLLASEVFHFKAS